MRYRTKPGPHGTLYRYGVNYTVDKGVAFTWCCWAYTAEGAVDRFHETNEGDYQWTGEHPRRIKEREQP